MVFVIKYHAFKNMLFMIYGNEIALRRRFVKDYNLPINVVDSPYFEYYMEKYDWFPKREYQELVEDIDTRFGGNINLWLEEYSKIRDEIITTIENSEAYKEFNNIDIKTWALSEEVRSYQDMNIYNQSTIGSMFISFDLKKANFQALRYVNPEIVFECDTYEELIDKFAGHDSEYLRTSKYTRQVIFGKLNPKRTIVVEKYIMSKVYDVLKQYFNFGTEVKLVTFKADELIFKVDERLLNIVGLDSYFNVIKEKIFEVVGVEVHAEVFKIGRIESVNHNNITVDCYIKKNLITGEEKLKSASQIFYPQLYCMWKGLNIYVIDLAFLAEGQIAHFDSPLTLKNIIWSN